MSYSRDIVDELHALKREAGHALAAILGLCNLIVALIVTLFALRRPASRELALAKEVHQDALTAFTAELEQAEAAAPASLRGALEGAAPRSRCHSFRS